MLSDFLERYRAGVFMVCFSVISLLFMALQVTPYVIGIKTSLWFLISPEVVYAGSFFNKIDSLQGRFFHLIRVEGENVILREQNAQLSKGEMERDVLELENNRLRTLLDLKEKTFSKSIAADVVAHDIRDWFHAFVINKGAQQGVSLSAAVVSIEKDRPVLIGRIAELDTVSSKVLLLTDAVSAISVSVARTGDIGLLEGKNRPWVLLNYLPEKSEITEGDEIITAGLGGLFPPGVFVGRVLSVMESEDGFFKQAKVSLAANLGAVENVLVLKRDIKP